MLRVRSSVVSLFLAASLAATLPRCTSSSPTATVCAPGSSTACTGALGCSGGQTCNDEGTGFEGCICLDARSGSETGRSSGDAGADSSRAEGGVGGSRESSVGDAGSEASVADSASDVSLGLGAFSCLEDGECLLFRTLSDAEAHCCTSDAGCCSDAGCSPHGVLGSACPTTGYEQGFLGTCSGGSLPGELWSYYSATTDADTAEDACVESMGTWSNAEGMGTCSRESSQVSMDCTTDIFYCTGSDTPATDGVAEMCMPLALEIHLPRDMSDGLTAYCCR